MLRCILTAAYLTAFNSSWLPLVAAAEAPALILHDGRIVTVSPKFTVTEAMAISGDRVLRVGSDSEILPLRGTRTEVIDLEGKMVLPGLIDCHAHPLTSSLVEFDHPIPQMDSIQDVLDYFAARAKIVPAGEWLTLRQVFITRLREQRYPTRAELDRAAPNHPVLFATGPDAMLNSLGLASNHIDRNFKVPDGPGLVEKDPQTGEPTGLVRTFARFVKVSTTGRQPTAEDQERCLATLFQDYNSVGITAVCERDVYPNQVPIYQALRDHGRTNLRVALSYHIDSEGELGVIQHNIRRVAAHPLFQQQDPFLRIIGIKTYLDGGMLTGSAYMQQPWGVSQMYGITDPAYRGVRFIPQERLVAMVRAAAENGLQFTAHSVGDGAVQALLDAYAEVSKTMPSLRLTRPCVSHSNFMTREAVDEAARLGVLLDIQPAWLYLDTRTLVKQFGYDRLRYFQPLHTIFAAGGVVGGGSDHMQKLGSLRSNNPYNPFLGMATAITRRARWYDGALHPEEALTREQAIQLYTVNSARVLFLEGITGSLQPGKLADFILIDRDLLRCPEADIVGTKVLRTYVGGRLVYSAAVKE